MNKYFIQLFLRENTVILPGFGALTAPNGNVEEIMFMPYLKTDDGKLADFIVETEGIDHQDAQNTIAKFIREMETNLSKGDSFDIFQFGSFFKNDSGEIEFRSSMKDKPVEEKKEVSILPPVNEEAAESVIPETIEPIEPIVQKVEPITFDTDSIEESSEVFTEFITEKVQDKSEEPPIIFTEKKEEGEVRIAPEPIIEKEKKRKVPVWLFPVLFISIVAVAIFLFWDRTPGETNEKLAKTESSKEELLKDSTEQKSISEPEKVQPAEEPKPEIPNPNSEVEVLPENAKGFFLIGGLYSSMEVAINKVKVAKKDGMNAKVLPQGNGKMYISLDDFTDRESANKMLKTLRDKGIKVWVLNQ